MTDLVHKMAQGKEGVVEHHARSGIAHHLAYLFAQFWFIAMNRALGAGRFIRLEGALLDPLHGIIK